jgi:K+-sensing histidine kinase KdpD
VTPAQVQLLVTAAQQLSLARNLDTIMQITRNTARELTGSDGATFVLKDHDKCFYADENAISPLWKGQRFPMTACISGWSMLNKQHAAIEDIYADERIPADAYRPTFVKSLAMVPIRKMDPIGAIGNYWASRHKPTDDEIMLLQSLADLTSVSMENYYAYAELEDRVQKRTQQLQELNKELDAFAYSVSHDLRAPLRAINGFAQILHDEYFDKLDEEGKDTINHITYSSVKMSNLIDNLLAFSKMGRQELNRSSINMNELTEGAIAELEKSLHHNAKITVKELKTVQGDYALLHQVMANLISNAIKYSAKKPLPEIVIDAEETDTEYIFSVADNGAGFNMKYADKLFGTFQRLHSDKEFEGTGVGLSLVRRLVAKHNGRVWATGKVEEGATFFFSLPKKSEA